jgi:hypothetical protein
LKRKPEKDEYKICVRFTTAEYKALSDARHKQTISWQEVGHTLFSEWLRSTDEGESQQAQVTEPPTPLELAHQRSHKLLQVILETANRATSLTMENLLLRLAYISTVVGGYSDETLDQAIKEHLENQLPKRRKRATKKISNGQL